MQSTVEVPVSEEIADPRGFMEDTMMIFLEETVVCTQYEDGVATVLANEEINIHPSDRTGGILVKRPRGMFDEMRGGTLELAKEVEEHIGYNEPFTRDDLMEESSKLWAQYTEGTIADYLRELAETDILQALDRDGRKRVYVLRNPWHEFVDPAECNN